MIDSSISSLVEHEYSKLDQHRLKTAIIYTKSILNKIYTHINHMYCLSTYDSLFEFAFSEKKYTISGNSIATLLHNSYHATNHNPKTTFIEQSLISPTGEEYNRFCIFNDDDSIGDFDVFFHKITDQNNFKQIPHHLKQTRYYDPLYSNVQKAAGIIDIDNYEGSETGVKIEKDEPIITNNAITMRENIQFIICKSGPNFTDSFDYEHCKMRYVDNTLFASKLQIVATINKWLVESNENTAAGARYHKYVKRGFTTLSKSKADHLLAKLNIAQNA